MNFKEAPKEYHIHIVMEDIESHLSKLDIDGQQGWRVPNALEIWHFTRAYNFDRNTHTVIKPTRVYWYRKFDDMFGLVSSTNTVIPKEEDAILVPVINIPETLVISPLEYHIRLMTKDEAIMYCFSLNINGDIGWRLPTLAEVRYMRLFRSAEIADADYIITIDGDDYHMATIPVRDARPEDQYITISSAERSRRYCSNRHKIKSMENTFCSSIRQEKLRQIIESASSSLATQGHSTRCTGT